MFITNIGGESFAVINEEARFSANYIYNEVFGAEVYGDVRPGDVVIDVGANIGLFTKYAIDKGAVKVICFEPDPYNLEMLKENSKIHGMKKFTKIIKKGVWSNNGKRKFISYNNRKGSCHFIDCNEFSVADGYSTFNLPLTTLDKELKNVERVDVIKMDIEGAEYEALKGAQETIRKHKPRLAISVYHNKKDKEIIPELILSLVPDYTVTTVGDRDSIMLFERKI